MKYKYKLAFFADTWTETNKHFCFKINNSKEALRRLEYFKTKFKARIRAAWILKCLDGLCIERTRIQ